jgi:hypothetical protein
MSLIFLRIQHLSPILSSSDQAPSLERLLKYYVHQPLVCKYSLQCEVVEDTFLATKMDQQPEFEYKINNKPIRISRRTN